MTTRGRLVSRNWYDSGLKRAFDLAVLIAAHIVLLPVWALLWTVIPALIWLADRGPIFFRQQRAGVGGKPFTVYKFRTMVPGADRLGPARTAPGDSRITPVGKWLRRTALDELPQVIAIWQGKMSFVGPRALSAEEQKDLEEKDPDFALRLQVRPGLTGLAQVRNLADNPDEKLRFDLDYIHRMSLWMDVSLITRSAFNTVFARWDARRERTPR
jgi:lipopolysaccharide/colanic/teichoic acid biosynthesis glycosyltransferase